MAGRNGSAWGATGCRGLVSGINTGSVYTLTFKDKVVKLCHSTICKVSGGYVA